VTTELLAGPVILTRYSGATNTKGSRVIATHKRDSQTTWRVSVPYEDSVNCKFPGDSERSAHYRAVERMLTTWPLFDSDPSKCRVVACGHDHQGYHWTVVGAWEVS
jgi:hypothetical protein